MTNLTECWFIFHAIQNEDREEPCAPIEFVIELDEIPEVMDFNESESGYYLEQIKWEITSINGDLSTPYQIVIDIHGNINPAYNAALMSLFGDQVGGALLMKSETYLAARRDNIEKFDALEENYIGSLSIVKGIVDGLVNDKLAKQVFGRLMTSSNFV
jgi:hypothetical protein